MSGKTPIAILISGRGSNMSVLVEASRAADCPYEVVLVASNNPDAPGLTIAREAGIATFAHSHKGLSRDAFDAIIDKALRDAGVRYVALAGYMRILSEDFVAGWTGRMLNIHPSLLPKYKGLDTHARAIAAGDAEGGCSVHIVTATLDDGEVVGQARVPILPGDTPETLADRVLAEEHRLYPAALADYIRTHG
ncbi:phosphoribosylglycinamide formyltransferase [Sphingomonas histidinilytica]|uniref:Phosphoribosylglycinamide formyltransferase n=1 Tax=Rhizorhabdus histidinilytica TaxID=439228 RepID=A0A1T4ZXH5_9SPHN|nr:phosphoribosylglycinamide formyltransferase [Rhizorhabdus histidinilytica]MBO9375943.1 phosphoribosylglycinamide formyltransferase [Rhizorhabdus histidinilytica]QEH78540.1 phosphoribosylglycinamide formyltransferase [Sphingomonas sp. C8-2]SKB27305.1 phosphoribosylglycinamide formyltransferase-1 [Rhizorhabdus histidinilytica]